MTMPPVEAYRELMAQLRETSKKFDEADDEQARFAACREQARAMFRFLSADQEVREGRLARPLGHLLSENYDAARGAAAPLLEHKPTRPGKPTETAQEVVQGVLAAALEIVIATRIGKDAALRWVAAEARQHKIADGDDNPVAGQRIASWRSEIGRGKAPKLARDTFRDWLAEPTVAPVLRELRRAGQRPRDDLVAKAQTLARMSINAVAARAPRSAPRLTRRSKEMKG